MSEWKVFPLTGESFHRRSSQPLLISVSGASPAGSELENASILDAQTTHAHKCPSAHKEGGLRCEDSGADGHGVAEIMADAWQPTEP